MSMHFRDLAEQVAADGAIAPEEILSLRRAGWTDGRDLAAPSGRTFRELYHKGGVR